MSRRQWRHAVGIGVLLQQCLQSGHALRDRAERVELSGGVAGCGALSQSLILLFSFDCVLHEENLTHAAHVNIQSKTLTL